MAAEHIEEEADIEIDPLLDHPYLEFPDDAVARGRCAKLRKMEIGGHDAICWTALGEVAEAERARLIIGDDTPWDRLFEMSYGPSFREITVEFLSSFQFHPRPADQPAELDDPAHPRPAEVSFRLFGQTREMTLRRFAVVCGLYDEAETETPLYTEAIFQADYEILMGFWSVIADDRFEGTKGRVSFIVDPLYRYLLLLFIIYFLFIVDYYIIINLQVLAPVHRYIDSATHQEPRVVHVSGLIFFVLSALPTTLCFGV